MTFLFFLKSAPWWLFSKTKLRHHYDFSHFLGPKLQRQFLGWKNAQIPQLIDSDGRALHKDSESGPNSKITKITYMTFLQTTAELFKKNDVPGRIASEIPPTDKAWKLVRLVDLAHMYLKAFTVISHLIFTDAILGRGSRLRKLSGRGLLWKRITHYIRCKDRGCLPERDITVRSGSRQKADKSRTHLPQHWPNLWNSPDMNCVWATRIPQIYGRRKTVDS